MLKCEVIGNLGADAVRKESNGRSFVVLSVAASRKFRRDDELVENTTWVQVIINWDCSKIMPYLLKGSKVFAQGDARLRCFKNNHGEWAAGLTIVCDSIELCGSSLPNTAIPANQSDEATNNAPFV